MRFFIWITVVSLLLLPASVLAEIYKYRDENGVIRYTDNIVEVPKSQQEKVQVVTEIKPLLDAGEVSAVAGTSEEAARLKEEKAALDKEYEQLQAESLELEEGIKLARPVAENALFEEKIKDFNLRLQQHEEKVLSFKAKVDAYNATVDAQFK